MSKNEKSSPIRIALHHINKRIKTIAELNKEIPRFEQTKDQLKWMLDSHESIPPDANLPESRTVFRFVNKLNVYLKEHELTSPDANMISAVSASGITNTVVYVNYASNVRDINPENDQVHNWYSNVRIEYTNLHEKQKRSVLVQRNLEKLYIRLSQLHKKATDATLASSSGTTTSIEGAALIRELLDQFKGKLIDRCRRGNGTKFERIAYNLAIDEETTFDAIAEQQHTYDSIHAELSVITKNRTIPSNERLRDILSLVEDFIMIIFNSLDPDKIGITFDQE